VRPGCDWGSHDSDTSSQAQKVEKTIATEGVTKNRGITETSFERNRRKKTKPRNKGVSGCRGRKPVNVGWG